MNGKVTVVTLIVNDQDAALKFYTEKAGFVKKTDLTGPGGYRWVTVGLAGQDLELALFRAGPDPNDPSRHYAPGSSPAIVIAVSDCLRTFEELKGRGVRFQQPRPEVHPWGTTATFSDPDGNRFSINQLKQYGASA